MSEQVKVFDYLLADAWHNPISQVSVFEGDPCWVRFSKRRSIEPFDYSFDDQHFDIDVSVIERIKMILRNSGVDKLEYLEDTLVTDGFIHEFVFFSGTKLKKIIGYNIGFCPKEPELYPNAMYLIGVLKQIAGVLIPLGADPSCFKLGIG